MDSEKKEKLKKIFKDSGNDLDFLSSIMQTMGLTDLPSSVVTDDVIAKAPAYNWKERKHKKTNDDEVDAGKDKKTEETVKVKKIGAIGENKKAEETGGGKKIGYKKAKDIESGKKLVDFDGDKRAEDAEMGKKTGGGALERVQVNKDGIVIDYQEIDPTRVSVHDICLQNVFGKCENEYCTRKICGPRKYLCEVLMASKYNRNVASKFLKKTEADTVETINNFMEMSDEEFDFASQVNTVCFWTVFTNCKNDKCPKKFCGNKYKDKIKNVILSSMIGIKKFALFMGYDEDSLERVPEQFNVPLISVPVLVKYLEMKAMKDNDDKKVVNARETDKVETTQNTGKTDKVDGVVKTQKAVDTDKVDEDDKAVETIKVDKDDKAVGSNKVDEDDKIEKDVETIKVEDDKTNKSEKPNKVD